MAGATWIAFAWRLPTGSSTPRVSAWRVLKRLGAATLTPGAAIVPYREDLLEQLGWLAQDIEELGGDAWVMPVTELAQAEEAKVRAQLTEEREAEYRELADQATAVGSGGPAAAPTNRELGALRRRLERIKARDHFGAPGLAVAARSIDLAGD
jgi:ChrB-like protein